MGQQTWNWLKANGIQYESRLAAKVLFAYGATEPLPTLEMCLSRVKGALCLDKRLETLSLLHVRPLPGNSVVSEHSEDDIRQRYWDLFTGIGLLKGYELKLHVDDTVKPLAQPVWRIPFGLCDKVDKKLDKLLQADIIEEVPEAPTGWILLW